MHRGRSTGGKPGTIFYPLPRTLQILTFRCQSEIGTLVLVEAPSPLPGARRIAVRDWGKVE
jgi:hypothetical protein